MLPGGRQITLSRPHCRNCRRNDARGLCWPTMLRIRRARKPVRTMMQCARSCSRRRSQRAKLSRTLRYWHLERFGTRATEAGRLRLRPRRGADLGRRRQGDHSRRRLHRRDAGHRARGARRRHPQRRPGAHHRLSDHRGRDRLDQPRRRTRRSRPRAGLRPGDRLRPGAGAGAPRSACPAGRQLQGCRDRRARGGGAAPAGASTLWPRASSPSRSSPATGSTCSTRRSSRRRRTPTGAARR